jgi:hypothetical protein
LVRTGPIFQETIYRAARIDHAHDKIALRLFSRFSRMMRP